MTKREAEELIEIEIDGTEKAECTEESIVKQTYAPAECVSQAIDINEPIGNLKKLLEPRLQCSLDAHEICLQDIQVIFIFVNFYCNILVCIGVFFVSLFFIAIDFISKKI